MDAPKEETPSAPSFRFSTRSLLWATALLSVGMGTFGPAAGAVLTVAVVAVNFARRRGLALARLAIVVGILAALVAFLLPAVPSARAAARRNASMNNLRMLALAIHNFENANGRLPPPYSVDDLGEPLHSWRTLVLQYLGPGTLYNKVRFDETWDSPANRTLFDAAGDGDGVFRSPREAAAADPKGATHYLAVVDDETLWSLSQVVRLQDVRDGASRTIALIEVAGRGVRWAEPSDLTMEEAIDVLVGEVEEEYVESGFFISKRMRGDGLPDRVVVFVDGHVETMAPLLRREDARALLTRAGGESANPFNGLPTRSVDSVTVGYIVHWGRIFGLTLFVVLALTPLLTKRSPKDAG